VRQESIATVAKHIVPTERRTDFRNWVEGIDRTSRQFLGYQGMEHIHARGESGDEHFCVFRFDSDEHLATWMSSDERGRWLADERSFGAEIFTARPYSSLEFWFPHPDDSRKAPPKYKTVLVTFLAIWPLVHFISPIASHLVQRPLVSEVLTVGVICALVTYVLMPIATRLLGWWLFE
jgi:antibiotic biosynthesis monooxygenase (ABM) superfamily enzyme